MAAKVALSASFALLCSPLRSLSKPLALSQCARLLISSDVKEYFSFSLLFLSFATSALLFDLRQLELEPSARTVSSGKAGSRRANKSPSEY